MYLEFLTHFFIPYLNVRLDRQRPFNILGKLPTREAKTKATNYITKQKTS